MSALILAPHHDDVALFSAFNAIRHRAHVVVVFRSVKQESLYGITHEEREAEERAALGILGCTFEQWGYDDDRELSNGVAGAIEKAAQEHERVFAPMPTRARRRVPVADGEGQHNLVGVLAHQRVEAGRLTRYLTYNQRGKDTSGVPVAYEPGWVPLKLRALACYESQMRTNAAEHFLRDQREYVA